jgi:hypothetical protein
MRHARSLPLLLVALCCTGCQSPRGAAKSPDRPYLQKHLVELTEIARQHSGPDWRDLFRASHLTQNIPGGFWYILFPVDAPRDRLLAEGKTLFVPDARLIAEDTSQSQPVRETAASFYGYFDEPWYLRWLAAQSYPSAQKQFELYDHLRQILPSLPEEISNQYDGQTQAWIKKALAATPDFETLVLARFDEIMKPDLPSQQDGLIDQDQRLIKWFNRFNDVDLDQWLAARAPKALEYRQRTLLNTGVDPLTAYAVFAIDAERRDILFSALPASEARQCLDLLNTVFPNGEYDSEKRPPQSDAKWRQRVCTWYWSHRQEFKYDPALRRFVIPAAQSPVSATLPQK